MAERTEQGIYVGMDIVPVDQNRRFFDQFRGMSRPDVVDNLHVTCLYPEEVASHGLAPWEVERLSQVASKIVAQIGGVDFIEAPIKIDPDRGIQGRKKWWTLTIARNSEHHIDRVRGLAADIVEDELGIRVAGYSPEGYHISLARRQNAGHDRLHTRIHPPLD